MSTSIQNEVRPTTVDLNQKKKTICGGCDSELQSTHSGLQCIQGHHYCSDCSKQIVNLVFSEPQHYIPPRCVQCHIELNNDVFERQLTAEQVEFYHQHMLALVWAKEVVGPGERLDNCPFCTFAVIRNIGDTTLFFCERPECRITSCLICRKACTKATSDYANRNQEAEILRHSICAVLADDKLEFDQAIELGQKMPCPKCGLAGMKDSSCTHMTCPTCSQVWCYFCGKPVEDCDKSKTVQDGIYAHNHNWDRNSTRCPMYFTQIEELDKRWPVDEDECLSMFHRIRSLRLLREVFAKLGKQRIDKLNRHFNLLDSCGFSLDEILNEDLTLIQFPRRHRRSNPQTE